jgi:hypothetical protein
MKRFKEIRQRLCDETPRFWKKVRRFAIVIGSAALGVWSANDTFLLDLPAWLLDICRYTLAACAALGLSAQLTTNTPPDEKTDVNN